VKHRCVKHGDEFAQIEPKYAQADEILLFKCKKAPEYRRPFAFLAASQGGEDALVIAMMGGSLPLISK